MSEYIFKRTHHGRFLGVPVWLDMTDEECPAIEAKYGILGNLAMDFMEALFGVFIWVCTMVNSDYEPLFPIMVGEQVRDNA
ncbi:hypothetical protein PR08_gp03 [Idiomarinaceae phage Phi1M2-2]|uniref:hypothetical protein n=1 Tax=Idiomarinaceae phage Phi1M2-2 TaxID=1527515 RepID=UPI0004F60178|nr:hypothetical protein PR08_gp03 [Idiomarinaceae phage Phi1M2-2]AIM40761.1 hypothetical protein M22_003 [Idiomarinaceae phage Phi1M2-2]